jgi:hypothetical protein
LPAKLSFCWCSTLRLIAACQRSVTGTSLSLR